jgi:hypothetical protein
MYAMTPKQSPRKQTHEKLARVRKVLLEAQLYRGVQTAVASKVGRSRSHVFKVLLGYRQSTHIEAELVRQIELAERTKGGDKKAA